MSLDAIIGKPVRSPDTVVVKPQEERVGTPDQVEESSMPTNDLERMLMIIRQRARRLRVFGGVAGARRVITEQSLNRGED